VEEITTKLIGPGKFRKFLYDSPRSKKVELKVEASSPIDIFIVSRPDLEQWKHRGDYGGISFFSRRTLEVTLKIPSDFEKDWYLILENRQNKQVAVHWELYDV
jgi:hypothetical protein